MCRHHVQLDPHPNGGGQRRLSLQRRAYERGDKFYVAGSARPMLTFGGNHVDIQLLGADGRVIAGDSEAIELGHPRGSRSRHGSDSFVTSFPIATARQAASVRVTFHSSGH